MQRGDVQTWVQSLQTDHDLLPSTAGKALDLLRYIFQYAIAEGWIDRDPTSRVSVPGASAARHEIHVITIEEREILRKVLASINPMWGAVVDLIGDAGLRIGEVQALRIENLDLDRGIVSVDSTVQRGWETSVVKPKTAAGRRDVPTLSSDACERLRSLVTGRASDDLVIRGPRRAMLDQGNFRTRLFKPAATHLELDVTPHGLRHHAVTVWLAAGIDDYTCAKWAGHTDAHLIQVLYGHAYQRPSETYAARLMKGRESLRAAERGLFDQ